MANIKFDNCRPQEIRSHDGSVSIGTMLMDGTLRNQGSTAGKGFFLLRNDLVCMLYSIHSPLSSRYRRSVPACKVVVAWTWTLTYMWCRGYERVELYRHPHVTSSWCGRGQLNELHRVSLCGRCNCRSLQQHRQSTYKSKLEALSRYHFCHGKTIIVTYSECVSVSLSYPACKAVLSNVAFLALQYFSTLPHKRHDFRRGGGFVEHKMYVLIFSTTFVWNISQCKENSARCHHKCT